MKVMFAVLVTFIINSRLFTDGAEIRGSNDVATQGQNFTLICSFTTTPQISVTFKRKLTTDNKLLTYFSFSLSGSECGGAGISGAAPESCTTSDLCTCSADRKLFSVFIPSVPYTWHNSEWTCEKDLSPRSPVLTLYLAVPFTKAAITPAGDLVANISSPVNAVCTLSPASRPQADISWTLRKTDETLIDITSSSTQVTDPNDNDPDTLKITRSTLTYTPRDKSYNGASIYCQATSNRTTTQTSQERRLVVQYSPEESIVITSNITRQLTEGMSVGLTCQVSGGNPLASLLWSCKGQPMMSVNKSTDSIAIWKLQIVVDRSYEGRICVCTGTHPLWTDTSSIALSVDYPPRGTPGLSITPQKPYYLVDDITTLTCKSPSTSKPAATITWSCKNQDVTSSATNRNVGNIADSSLVIKVESRYNGQLCDCTVSHRVNSYRQSVNITFNVHYTPTESLVLIADPNEKYKGDNVQIGCSIKGGNPLSVVTLSCGATQGTDNSNIDTSSRFIYLKSIDKDRNNQTCVCKATHSDYAAFRPKKELTLVVYYPPETPTIMPVTETFPWLEEQIGQLSCSTVSGNPAATGYQWMGRRISVKEGSRQSVSIGRLSYADDKTQYKCQVSNKFTVEKGVTVSGTITIDVQYKPRILLNRNQAAIRETETFIQHCNATGNPKPSIQWCHGSSLQCSEEQNPAILSFEKTLRINADNYTCKARSNSDKYGKLESSSTFTLTVNYSPDVNVTATNIAFEGITNFAMSCNVQGVPSTYNFHKWQHHYDGILIRELTYDPVYRFSRPLSFEDSGNYTCIVDNGVTDGNGVLLQNNTFHVMVQFRPRFVTEPITQVSAENQASLSVGLEFIAFPDINYSVWRREYGNFRTSTIKSTIQHPVVTTFYGKPVTINKFGYQSWLKFSNFSTTDTGQYSLTVGNIEGVASYSFKAGIKGPPDLPNSLQFVSITASSVTVNWLSGENNGFRQTFYLSYRSMGTMYTQDVHEISSQKNYSVRVSSLKPQTLYTLELTVSNERGFNPGVLSKNVTTLKDNATGASTDTAPNTASIVLFALGALLFAASVTGFGIRCIRKKQRLQNNDYVRGDNRGDDNKHTYDSLELDPPPETHYQDIGTPGYDSTRNTDVRNMYSGLGQRDVPNVYEKIKSHKKVIKQAQHYENTCFNQDV